MNTAKAPCPKVREGVEVLHEMAELMIVTQDLDRLLNLICEKAASFVRVKRCSLMLVDEQTGSLVIRSAIGLPEDVIKTTKLKIGEKISGWVAKNEKPLLVRDIEKDPRFAMRNKEMYLTKSLLSIPLKMRGRVIGVLNVNNKESGGVFDESDLKILETLGVQVAVAIENSRLYTELSEVQKRLEDDKKQMEEMVDNLKKLDRMKEEFVSIVSHELRTPLTSVKEALAILIDEIPGKVNEDQKEFLYLAKHDCERLSHLLNDILDLSRIEAGKLQMHIERIDINDAIEASIASLKPMAAGKGMRLSNSAGDGLPGIPVDQKKIEQVLINLISNAIKFSANGSEVVVGARDDGQELCVSVADSGIGIAEADIPRIFDRFRQVDSSSTRKVEGTGLGLCIVKGLVEAHGGRITVESEVGRGSTFTLHLLKEGPPKPAAGE